MDKKIIEFTNKANKIHNNKYNYELVDYKNHRIKIKIVCPEHGIFEQTPDKHLNFKRGCHECGGTKKLTIETFITNVKKLHNNLFEYPNINFKNTHDYINIICSKHGEFEEKPCIHLQRNTCEGCKKDITLNRYIEDCKIVHNNKYGYSLIKYNTCYDKVEIICPTHGIFKQALHSHKQGVGCPKCKTIKSLGVEKFIEKAKNIHLDKYEYNLVDYKNNKAKVKIVCKEHGMFEQQPYAHLNGQGCIKCIREKRITTLSDFILKANIKHNNRYNYEYVNFKALNNKIDIICKIHGNFSQLAYMHLQGQGCPKCKFSKGEMKILNYLNLKNIKYISQQKIKIENKTHIFDFYLPDYNSYIEYDGEQHFKPIKYFGGNEKFNQRINNDFKKEKYCIENDIKLIRIPYWNFEKIENILEYLNIK